MLLVVLLLLLLQLLLVLFVLHRQLVVVLGGCGGLCSTGLLVVRQEGGGEEVVDVVVVGQSTGGGRHPEVAVLRQDDVLGAQTHLVLVRVVVHAAVEEHGQDVVVVLDLGLGRIWFVPEVAQTPGQGLRGAVVVVVEGPLSVVQHGHDVRVVVLVVVVEGVEEEAETDPLVRRTVHVAIVVAVLRGVPEGQAIGSQSATTGDPELDLYLPPVEVRWALRPNGSLLTAQRGGHTHLIGARDGICGWTKSCVVAGPLISLEFLSISRGCRVAGKRMIWGMWWRGNWRRDCKCIQLLSLQFSLKNRRSPLQLSSCQLDVYFHMCDV